MDAGTLGSSGTWDDGGLPAWSPSTITTALTWDSLGNRLSEQDSSTKIAGRVVHAYTGRSLVQRSTYGDDDKRIDRTYDTLGRLTSVGPQGSLEPYVSFTYGTLGSATHRQDHHNGPTLGTDYSYDPLGRLEKIITKDAAGSVLARWRYELALDGVPRVAVSKLGTLPEVASVYTADSGGRLRSETHDLSGLGGRQVSAAPEVAPVPAVVPVPAVAAASETTVGPRLLVNAQQKAINVLRPEGRLVGNPGSSKAIRLIEGGQAEARTLFRQLVRETGATPITEARFPGTLVELPGGGGRIGFRAISQSGPPTIGVFIPGLGIREIKLIP